MLVSHRCKFIYTKTVKTAGTSVESYFERFCMSPEQWSQDHSRDESVSEFGIVGFRGANPPQTCRFWNHMPAKMIKEQIGEEIWNDYFKFCVIRNPFEKVISTFFFSLQKSVAADAGQYTTDQIRSMFENWVAATSGLPVDRDKYVIDGRICMDDFIRYERLHQEMERICKYLHLPWDRALLPSFKTGIRPGNSRAVDLYSERSRKIVEEVFAFELEQFNYRFPS